MFTWVSHGLDEYEDRLLNAMRKELHLETSQELEDLIECPMSKEALIALLTQRGAIKV